MMDETKIKSWMEATGGIREEYVEEAALPRQKRRIWPRLLSAAAVLALVIGMTVAMWPKKQGDDIPIPFFAVRAYAEDGTEATLVSAGDTIDITASETDLFPGRQIYTLDVSLGQVLSQEEALENCTFELRHNGVTLGPGESDEELRIDWHTEDGFSGYRIVGWCEEYDYLDITIRDKNGLIMHQKTMRIDFEGEYTVKVYTSYTYEEGLTTEQLIAKLFDTGQEYWLHTAIASTPYVEYRALVTQCGGFAELEQRSDAASFLLERWVREMETAEHAFTKLEYSGRIGLMLSQDVYWNRLTAEEKALIKSYGCSREEKFHGSLSVFPGKQTFSYELIMDGRDTSGHRLSVDYPGKTEQGKDAHITIFYIMSVTTAENPVHGWGITGWFDEPTELILAVTDRDGNLVRQEHLMITPHKDGYQIDIIEQLP